MLGVKDAANMFDDIERQLYREIRRIRKDLD